MGFLNLFYRHIWGNWWLAYQVDFRHNHEVPDYHRCPHPHCHGSRNWSFFPSQVSTGSRQSIGSWWVCSLTVTLLFPENISRRSTSDSTTSHASTTTSSLDTRSTTNPGLDSATTDTTDSTNATRRLYTDIITSHVIDHSQHINDNQLCALWWHWLETSTKLWMHHLKALSSTHQWSQ